MGVQQQALASPAEAEKKSAKPKAEKKSEAEKKSAKPKAEKKSAKPKAEKKSAKPKAEEITGPKADTGSKLTYKGGSKVEGVRAGAVAVVVRAWPEGHKYHRRYYGVKFGSGKDAHVHTIAAKYFTK